VCVSELLRVLLSDRLVDYSFVGQKLGKDPEGRSQIDTIVLWSTNLLSDTLVTAALCMMLRKRRSDFIQSSTNRILNNIILFCVERFILSTVISVAGLVIEIALPNGFYVAVINMVYGKVVANSLLATLNSRGALKGSNVRERPTSVGKTRTSIPMSPPRAVPSTTITTMYRSEETVESSIDDREGYGLRTRDLQESIYSDKV